MERQKPHNNFQMFPIKTLNPQERHNYILQTFILNKAAAATSKHKRDIDVIRENHKFLWEDEEEPDTWETKLAKKYYDKLFKEYCIADLSRYKENKIALRWRTEQEVVSGKGQFMCGSRKCTSKENLRSWEVNFGYMERGEKKNALIKLRLCPDCSKLLNYTHQKREVKKLEKPKSSKKSKSKTNKDSSKKTDEHSPSKPQETATSQSLPQAESNEKSVEQSNEEDAADIWKKQDMEVETIEREEEFEKYLEDLLL